jgi:hypothetical protein
VASKGQACAPDTNHLDQPTIHIFLLEPDGRAQHIASRNVGSPYLPIGGGWNRWAWNGGERVEHHERSERPAR